MRLHRRPAPWQPTSSRRPEAAPGRLPLPAHVSVANGRTLSIPIIDPRCRRSVWRSIRQTAPRNPLAAIRLTNDGDSGLPAGLDHPLRARQGRVRLLCRRCPLSGFRSARRACWPMRSMRKITIERDAAQTERIATGTIARRAAALARHPPDHDLSRARPAKESRLLIVVQRRLPGWTLVKPTPERRAEPRATTASRPAARRRTRPRPSRSCRSRHSSRSLRLVDTVADQIRVYAQAREFDDKTRVALINVLHLQSAVAEASARRRRLTPIAQIVQEQARLGDNLARVPATATFSRRYCDARQSRKRSSRRSPTPRDAEKASRPHAERCGPMWRSSASPPARSSQHRRAGTGRAGAQRRSASDCRSGSGAR